MAESDRELVERVAKYAFPRSHISNHEFSRLLSLARRYLDAPKLEPWSKEPPKERGWYWWRQTGTNEAKMQFLDDIEWWHGQLAAGGTGEWLGPIMPEQIGNAGPAVAAEPTTEESTMTDNKNEFVAPDYEAHVESTDIEYRHVPFRKVGTVTGEVKPEGEQSGPFQSGDPSCTQLDSARAPISDADLNRLEALRKAAKEAGPRSAYAVHYHNAIYGAAESLIAAARRVNEERCEQCGGELSFCGEPNVSGEPSLDCRACKWKEKAKQALKERDIALAGADERAAAEWTRERPQEDGPWWWRKYDGAGGDSLAIVFGDVATTYRPESGWTVARLQNISEMGGEWQKVKEALHGQ